MNGIVLPSYVYNGSRAQLATVAFDSLAKTLPGEKKAKLLLILKLSPHYVHETGRFQDNFDLEVLPDPSGVYGTESTLAWGTEHLFEQGCDTVTWMGDDALFHPEWILKLRELINAKSDAKAWSVYRSNYTAVHQTIKEDGDYVQVSSVCGHGFTVSRREWELWGVKWFHGPAWISPYGDTLDMHHIFVRSGERWVTSKSYVDHTGRTGLHCQPHIPEYAMNFQGA